MTSWELVLLDPSKLEALVEDLRQGATIGTAVGRFNRSAASRRTATRLCIFGDPRTRAAPKFPRPDRPVPGRIAGAVPHARAPDDFDDEQRELAFSRACLAKFIERTDEEYGRGEDGVPTDRLRMRNSASSALECLHKVEERLWGQQRNPDGVRLGRKLLRQFFSRISRAEESPPMTGFTSSARCNGKPGRAGSAVADRELVRRHLASQMFPAPDHILPSLPADRGYACRSQHHAAV